MCSFGVGGSGRHSGLWRAGIFGGPATWPGPRNKDQSKKANQEHELVRDEEQILRSADLIELERRWARATSFRGEMHWMSISDPGRECRVRRESKRRGRRRFHRRRPAMTIWTNASRAFLGAGGLRAPAGSTGGTFWSGKSQRGMCGFRNRE